MRAMVRMILSSNGSGRCHTDFPRALGTGKYSACHCERSEAISLVHKRMRLLRRYAPRNDKYLPIGWPQMASREIGVSVIVWTWSSRDSGSLIGLRGRG